MTKSCASAVFTNDLEFVVEALHHLSLQIKYLLLVLDFIIRNYPHNATALLHFTTLFFATTSMSAVMDCRLTIQRLKFCSVNPELYI